MQAEWKFGKIIETKQYPMGNALTVKMDDGTTIKVNACVCSYGKIGERIRIYFRNGYAQSGEIYENDKPKIIIDTEQEV